MTLECLHGRLALLQIWYIVSCDVPNEEIKQAFYVSVLYYCGKGNHQSKHKPASIGLLLTSKASLAGPCPVPIVYCMILLLSFGPFAVNKEAIITTHHCTVFRLVNQGCLQRK